MRNVATVALACALGATDALAQFETRAATATAAGDFAGLAVGDFNGDGKPDLAVADDDLQILLGNGDGTFGTPSNYLAGLGTFSVAAADLNGDHKLDLVVTDFSGVSVLLGNGDGTFQAASTYTTACIPIFAAAGDFNGDGKPDLAVTYSGTGCPYVSIFLGNGDGTFQTTPINTAPSLAPSAIGIGDFNHDGKLDVAVAEQFGMVSQVEILLGNGDGTFSAGDTYKTGSFPTAVTVTDFRANGKLDLAIATLYGGTDTFLGNGDGTFQAGGEIATPDAVAVIAADFNGDGKPDLAVVQQNNPSGAYVALGNGNGTFQVPVFYPVVGVNAVSVASGDFNGDHKIDLLVANRASVTTLLNTGVASFNPATAVNYPFQLVGVASPTQTVKLTNTGTAALTISAMKTSAPFKETNTCGGSVAPGANCAIHIVFKPSAMGSVSGTINISDSASSKQEVIELAGAGTVVSVSPLKLSFGDQKSGTQSPPTPVTLKNTGSTALTFSAIGVGPGGNGQLDFTSTNNCTAQALAAGASCTVNVIFAPRKTGPLNTILFIYDNGGGSPQSVPLSGTGD